MGGHTDPGAAGDVVLLAPPEGVTGLSSAEAARRLARDGPNQFVPTESGGRWRRILGPLADPMVALLLIVAPTYLLIGDTTDAIVVFVALVPIAAVGWVLEAAPNEPSPSYAGSPPPPRWSNATGPPSPFPPRNSSWATSCGSTRATSFPPMPICSPSPSSSSTNPP